MTVRFSDRMTAVSGTRALPQAGGYNNESPTAIFTQENPNGPTGKFRTIEINYEMKVTKIVTIQPPPTWASGAAPSFLLSTQYNP